jgi:hypothetical protein
MHTNFADWYRIASLEPNAELLPKRWAAIEEFSPDAKGVVSLIQLFYQLGAPDPTFVGEFQAVFQKHDAAFQMRGNEQELRVLAGAELADIMHRGEHNDRLLAALGLVCASAQNIRTGPCVPDIPEFAASFLVEASRDRATTDGPDTELTTALKELGEPYDKLAAAVQDCQKELRLVSEESNILWWLFSEHSRDQQQRWETFDISAAALIAGKELADLTSVLPGPSAAAAFLDKMMRCCKSKLPDTITIKSSIEKSPTDWRQKFAKSNCPDSLDLLMPISQGIKISVLSAPDAWAPTFVHSTGVPLSAKLSPALLSRQVYLEGLLVKAWRSSN